LILCIAACAGAAIGGFLDDRLGSKWGIMGALVLLIVGTLGVILVDRSYALFVVYIASKPEGSGAFASTGEQIYLAFALLIGIASSPLQSASRSLAWRRPST
jgi:UMF1 family MFS transporter